jgi:DNA-binding winged helix-turn-helix (wHTH) protein/tetratricopeptide (TPR) repeat protein
MSEDLLHFEDFVLNRGACELRRGAVVVPLQRIPLELLCLLVERRGQLVTREEILERVWGKGVFVDSETSINTAVRKVRQALCDNPDAPRFVATLPGRGYRFLAEVTRAATNGRPVRIPSMPEGPAPIVVGRETELARLQSWSAQAIEGRRRVVFVAGEAGIGKTTFLKAFLDSLGGSAARIGRGQCVEQYGAGEPYMPVLEALTRLCQESGGQHVVDLLHQFAPTWLAQMPSLLSNADRERLQTTTQGVTQQRMLREMTQALEALAAETPLVLALEDLHWSDFSTLELISAIARRTEPARLLILGTYRPTEMLARDHPLRTVKQELELHRNCEELRLKLLSEADVAEYLAKRFADDNTARSLAGVAPLIHERTDGNPLFMVNVVDYLVEQGSPLNADKIEAPRSILQMIERNLERLNPDEQRVLEAASGVGAEFSAATVASALERPLSEIEATCTRLSRHEQFVTAHGISEWPDGTVASRFRFHHALYGDVLYGRMPAGHRVELHRRIAEREEKAHGERAGEIAAELAHHYSRANDRNKAIEYFQIAGERAAVRYAMVEAERHYTKALKLLDELPETPERDRQELALQILLGSAAAAVNGLGAPERERSLMRARDLSQRLGEQSHVFTVLWQLFHFHAQRGELQTAREYAEHALAVAESQCDAVKLAGARTALGLCLFYIGDFAACRRQFELALSPDIPLQKRWYLDERRPDVLAGALSALAEGILGYPDRCCVGVGEVVTRARTQSSLPDLAFALVACGRGHLLAGSPSSAQSLAEETITLSETYGYVERAALGKCVRGVALTRQGELKEGIACILQGLSDYSATGGRLGQSEFYSALAAAFGKAGRTQEGLEAVDLGLAMGRDGGESFYRGELYRIRGELIQIEDSADPHEAERLFRTAIDTASRRQARLFELRATTSLARLLAKQGHRDEARTMLAEIYNWFTEGFDSPDLKDAKTLLDELNE